MNPSNRKILVVEDNPDDETMLLEALRSNGLGDSVIVARNGEEALNILFGNKRPGNQPAEPPSVVLLDLKLPKVDGLEVLGRIRSDRLLQSLPVVVVTSSDEERDLVESYKLAANAYVRKPVEFAELVEAFRQLGIYWLAINPDSERRGN